MTYWSCTKFARMLRNLAGYTKPTSATMEEWDMWRQQHQQKHPVAYILIEDGLNAVQDVIFYIPNKIHDLRVWVRHQFVNKTHVLHTGLKRGVYHELDDRILHGLFTALVDFIEVEKANALVRWDDESLKKHGRIRWPRILMWGKPWRSREAGLEYLQWEMNTDNGVPAHQADVAKEAYELYQWWTVTRPSRRCPYDVSGINALTEAYGSSFSQPPQVQAMFREAYAKLHAIDQERADEDTAMCIRLIKIRQGLWC